MFLTEDRTTQPSVQHLNVVNKCCFCKISILPWLTEYYQAQLGRMVYTESQNTCLEAVDFTECSILLLLISCIEPKTGSLTLSKIHWQRPPCLLGGQQNSSKVFAPSMEHRGGRPIHADTYARMQVDFVFDGSQMGNSTWITTWLSNTVLEVEANAKAVKQANSQQASQSFWLGAQSATFSWLKLIWVHSHANVIHYMLTYLSDR